MLRFTQFVTAGCTLALLTACTPTADKQGNSDAAGGNETAAQTITMTDKVEPAANLLNPYIGKYPPELVDGVSFLKNPVVRAAAAATRADADVIDWIFERAGPQTPITEKNGQLLSWGCETHNCGAHNWTLFISPDGQKADICYYDSDTSAKSKWWLASGATEERENACPSDSSEQEPSAPTPQ